MKKGKIFEALKLSQYREYDKQKMRPEFMIRVQLEDTFKNFKGKKNRSGDRLYIPFDFELKENVSVNYNVISNIVKLLGYKINNFEDYLIGICYKTEGTDKRKFRIGKILNDAKKKNVLLPSGSKVEEFIPRFTEDPDRKIDYSGKYLICISKHPYDIAGMSTDRGWRSCMNLVDGAYKEKIEPLIKEGGLVAYLIKEDDLNIEHPLGRVTIYPMRGNDKYYNLLWKCSTICYGSLISNGKGEATIVNTIQEFLNSTLNANKEGMYSRISGPYNEGIPTKTFAGGKSEDITLEEWGYEQLNITFKGSDGYSGWDSYENENPFNIDDALFKEIKFTYDEITDHELFIKKIQDFIKNKFKFPQGSLDDFVKSEVKTTINRSLTEDDLADYFYSYDWWYEIDVEDIINRRYPTTKRLIQLINKIADLEEIDLPDEPTKKDYISVIVDVFREDYKILKTYFPEEHKEFLNYTVDQIIDSSSFTLNAYINLDLDDFDDDSEMVFTYEEPIEIELITI